MTLTAFIIVAVILVVSGYICYRWGKFVGTLTTMEGILDAIDSIYEDDTFEEEDQCSQ